MWLDETFRFRRHGFFFKHVLQCKTSARKRFHFLNIIPKPAKSFLCCLHCSSATQTTVLPLPHQNTIVAAAAVQVVLVIAVNRLRVIIAPIHPPKGAVVAVARQRKVQTGATSSARKNNHPQDHLSQCRLPKESPTFLAN